MTKDELELLLISLRTKMYTTDWLLGIVLFLSTWTSYFSLCKVLEEVFGSIGKAYSEAVQLVALLVAGCYNYFLIYKLLRVDVRGERENYSHPNIAGLIKGLVKGVVSVLFTSIDSLFKDKLQGWGWVASLGASTYLHLVHFMVLCRFHEDYDVHGAFLQIGFVVVYEMGKTWEKQVPSSLCVILLSVYKAFVLDSPMGNPQHRPLSILSK